MADSRSADITFDTKADAPASKYAIDNTPEERPVQEYRGTADATIDIGYLDTERASAGAPPRDVCTGGQACLRRVSATAHVGESGVRAVLMCVEKLRVYQRVEHDPASRSVDTAETPDLLDRQDHARHLQILRADSFQQVTMR
jgi:hypothetical protein